MSTTAERYLTFVSQEVLPACKHHVLRLLHLCQHRTQLLFNDGLTLPFPTGGHVTASLPLQVSCHTSNSRFL